ncbi:hypothetical protein [Paenibacillus sp. FSL W8-0194]|uniref:hypothetical protein n=1 Tax=Paenibacillus sp. FSL W8-0194 TaxID=2921711 RepID=UPI0030D7792A
MAQHVCQPDHGCFAFAWVNADPQTGRREGIPLYADPGSRHGRDMLAFSSAALGRPAGIGIIRRGVRGNLLETLKFMP